VFQYLQHNLNEVWFDLIQVNVFVIGLIICFVQSISFDLPISRLNPLEGHTNLIREERNVVNDLFDYGVGDLALTFDKSELVSRAS
jgi:hypothetical protein